MIYEGQPFQTYFIRNIRKIFNLKIVGLCHAYQALPVHLLKKNYNCEPDQLIVHLKEQQNSLVKYLGWKKNEITYKYREIKEVFLNCIYLPYTIEDEKKYIAEFKYFLESYKDKLINYYIPVIKIHPAKNKSQKHLNFKKKINFYLKANKKNFSKIKNKKNLIIFFGPSSGVVRALYKNQSVVQICINPYTDVFSHCFWPNFKIKYIDRGIRIYEKIK